MILGLTGGIATGKSTTSKIIKKIGIPVVDADEISRKIVYDMEIILKIKEEFGEEIYIIGELDREKLSRIVFSNKDKLKKLNMILHPAILKKIKEEFEKLKKNKIIVADIPLLFEVSFEDEVDKILTIYCDLETQIERLKTRKSYTREESLKRINSQMKTEEKIKKSDYIINNSKNLEFLEKEVQKIIKKIKNEIK